MFSVSRAAERYVAAPMPRTWTLGDSSAATSCVCVTQAPGPLEAPAEGKWWKLSDPGGPLASMEGVALEQGSSLRQAMPWSVHVV